MKSKTILTLATLASSLGLSHGAAIHNGLLNYYSLDGNANDTASSYAGSTGTTADNGNVNGTATFGAGLFGSAGSFPGGAGNNITVADPTAGTDDIDRSGSDLSISVWVQAAAWDTSWQGIVAHGEGADYRIARQGGNNPVNLAYAGGTGDITSVTTYGAAPAGDGLWHHIVATTANGGATQLFVDGLLEATGAGPAAIAPSGANLNVLCIGCNPDNGREFNGLIDDLGMWDRALSLTEVQEIYQAGLQGTALGAIPEPSTGLLGLLGLSLIFRRRR